MAKRYYWLKLNENFFDDDTISFIEEQENGVYYVNFYLKLCLKALKTEGKLIRLIGENLIPYDIKSLAKLTNTPLDTVRVAMELFKKIGLVKVLDSGELYLSQLNEMIGTETDKARLMREKRALQNNNGNNVTTNSNNVTRLLPDCYSDVTKCYTEKEIEKEKEVDIEVEVEKEHPLLPLLNSQCVIEYKNKINPTCHSMELEKLVSWLDDGIKEDLIIEAINEAVLSNVRNYKYIASILNRCLDRGIKTKEQFIADKSIKRGGNNDRTNKQNNGTTEATEDFFNGKLKEF